MNGADRLITAAARDCMIAAVAWRRDAVLLSYDVDLDRLAGVIGLKLDDASLRAQQRLT